MLLNLISNMSQMCITVLLGLIGLSWFVLKHSTTLAPTQRNGLILILITLLLIGLIGYFTVKKIRGFYLDKIKEFIQQIPRQRLILTFGLSLLRYLIFSHQFYFVLMIFGTSQPAGWFDLSYIEAMTAISSVYLIASIIPSISFFDWLIKGSVAVWIFAFYEIAELTILSLTLLMWMLNFGLPALFGSYFVLNFNLNQRI